MLDLTKPVLADGDKLICFGDSLTAQENSYVTALARELVAITARKFAQLPRACACPNAMAGVLATDPAAIPPATRAKYALIFGKYLK